MANDQENDRVRRHLELYAVEALRGEFAPIRPVVRPKMPKPGQKRF